MAYVPPTTIIEEEQPQEPVNVIPIEPVTPVVPEEPVNNNEPPVVEDTTNYVYATFGHSDKYDAYYHDYADCTFIEGKGAKAVDFSEVMHRYACKCVHQGRFWE